MRRREAGGGESGRGEGGGKRGRGGEGGGAGASGGRGGGRLISNLSHKVLQRTTEDKTWRREKRENGNQII